MTQTVFAHIGAFKTGTTYTQHVLWQNKERLAADGILFPESPNRRDQITAVWDLLNFRRSGFQPADVPGGWQRLTEAIARWDGPTAVVSGEMLSQAKPRHVRRMAADLSPAELHVVLTARDLARVLPASWQERLKNARSFSWPEFMTSVQDTAREHEPGLGFWRQQDLSAILRRWNAHVPAEHIHVVTVPPPGSPRGLLLERLGQVIGSDATQWDPEVENSNESLGAAEAQLLLRVNERIKDQVTWQVYAHAVKNVLARGALAGRPNSRPIVLPAEYHGWATDQARLIVEELRADGYPVEGDLADLIPAPSNVDDASRPPHDAPVEEVLAAAEDAIVALVSTLGTRNVWLRDRVKEHRKARAEGSAQD